MASRGFPGAEYLDEAQLAVENRFRSRNEHLADIRLRRRDLWLPKIPEPYAEVATIFPAPFTRQLVNRVQSLISAEMPTAHRAPLRPDSPKSRDEAELIERWFNEGAYPRMQEDTDVWSMVTDSLAEGGHGVWKLIPKKHLWGRETQRKAGESDGEYNDRTEEVRRNHFPFFSEHVPTTSFYPICNDEDGLAEVLELTTHEKPIMYDRYRKELGRLGVQLEYDRVPGMALQTTGETCEFVQYWNRDSFIYRLDGIEVKRGTHRGRRPPYYHALFSQTGAKDPGFESESLCDSVIGLQDWVKQGLTDKSVWSSLTSYPIFVLKKISDDALPQYDKKFTIEWARGETTRAPDGYEWVPLAFPPTGQDLNQMISLAMSLIDQVSLAPILFGKVEGGQESGTVMHGLVQLARAIFGPALASISRQYNLMAGDMLYLIEHDFRAPVPVERIGKGEWLEIGAPEIGGNYRVTHTLAPLIAMEQMVDYQMASDQQKNGYVTKAYVRSKIPGIKYPQQMADDVLTEAVAGSPQVAQLIIAQILEEEKASEQPAPPTVESLTGMPVPGAAPAPNVPQGLAGPGVTELPGIQQPINPGMQPSLPATPPPGVGTT